MCQKCRSTGDPTSDSGAGGRIRSDTTEDRRAPLTGAVRRWVVTAAMVQYLCRIRS